MLEPGRGGSSDSETPPLPPLLPSVDFPPIVAKIIWILKSCRKKIWTPFLSKILLCINFLYMTDSIFLMVWDICLPYGRFAVTTSNTYTFITIIDTESIKGSKIIQNEISDRTLRIRDGIRNKKYLQTVWRKGVNGYSLGSLIIRGESYNLFISTILNSCNMMRNIFIYIDTLIEFFALFIWNLEVKPEPSQKQ